MKKKGIYRLINPRQLVKVCDSVSSQTSTSPSQQVLEEPDNQFGRMTYWDQSYRESLVDSGGSNDDNGEQFTIILQKHFHGIADGRTN